MAFMIPYAIVCLTAITGLFDGIIGKPTGWILAVVVSLPIMGQIWSTLDLMRESDEFVRAVTARQFIIASGLAMAGATLWGFGETFAGAPHIPAWMVYPLFWGAFGCVAPFVKSSNG
jgi:hypothetical protein